MRPKLEACVARRRGRRRGGADHRRPRRALAPPRALHRRRDRHQGDGVKPAERRCAPDAQLRALPGRVRARRGRPAVGLRRRRVPGLPHRHLGVERRPLPPGGRRRDPRAGRDGCSTSATSTTPSRCRGSRAARRELAGRQGVLHQLGRRGRRGGDQVRAQGAPGRHDRLAPRRLPRSHLRRAVGDAAGVQAGAVRAARRRGSSASTRRWRRSTRRRRAHGGGDPRADPGRDGRPRAPRRAPARRARALRPDRRDADLRRDPDGLGRTGYAGATSTRGRARPDHQREVARRRPPDRRADHRRRVTPTRSRPATTARRSPAARSSAPPPTRRSTCCSTRRCSPG